MLWLTDGSFKVIEPEKAITIWSVLNGEVEPTEEQAAFLPNVRDIFIPPSYHDQAPGYLSAHKHARERFKPGTTIKLDVTDLHDPDMPQRPQEAASEDWDTYHPGIEQGMSSAIPNGDR